MSILARVRDNAWLLGVCRDWPTWRAMKRRSAPAAETVSPLRFRSLGTPILYRSGTSDISVAWELFRTQEYACARGWNFPRVVDCGANVGLFMAFAAMQMNGRLHRYVGVEADRSAFALLERQATALGLESRVRLLHAAAWCRDGEVLFDESGESWARHVSDSCGTRVRALGIGSILDAAGLEECDLLKLDIEGGERVVLPEIRSWGPRVRTLVAELHDGLDYAWFSTTVEAAGFQPYPAGTLFRAHPSAVRRDVLRGSLRPPGGPASRRRSTRSRRPS